MSIERKDWNAWRKVIATRRERNSRVVMELGRESVLDTKRVRVLYML